MQVLIPSLSLIVHLSPCRMSTSLSWSTAGRRGSISEYNVLHNKVGCMAATVWNCFILHFTLSWQLMLELSHMLRTMLCPSPSSTGSASLACWRPWGRSWTPPRSPSSCWFGKPCFVENAGEELDPAPEPILLQVRQALPRGERGGGAGPRPGAHPPGECRGGAGSPPP